MKTIANWADLEAYGIVPLTGEACGLTYRILCDLTRSGLHILEKCLSCQLLLPDNWNHGTNECPHIGSIMLAPCLLEPLAVFALLETGCTEVWLVGNTLFGIEPTDDPTYIEQLRQFHQPKLKRRFAYQGDFGDRNLHRMTGRVQ